MRLVRGCRLSLYSASVFTAWFLALYGICLRCAASAFYRFCLPAFRAVALRFRFAPAHPENRTGKVDLDSTKRTSVRPLRFASPLTLSPSRFRSASPPDLPPPSDQALDRLVSAHSIRYRTSMSDLSTSSSLRGLTCFTSGNLFLQVGFTLRCLQRLSRPHFASQLCRWHDNCCTRGASIPVLSY